MIVRTMPYADLLVDGDEGLVLFWDEIGTVPISSQGPGWDEIGTVPNSYQGGTIARLSAIGVEVLQLAADGIEFDELAHALEARFGAPPSGTTQDALKGVLEALQAQRLVDLSTDEPDQPDGTDEPDEPDEPDDPSSPLAHDDPQGGTP